MSGQNEVSGVVHGPTVQAGAVHGDIHIRTEAPTVLHGPWQLPSAVPLIDRTAEIDLLERHRARGAEHGHAVVAAVSGLGGVGKTALALGWLHSLRPDFPDGQLYADLGAQSPGGPATPTDVLSRFLRGLGVAPQLMPSEIAERAALFRSLTAERRMVVLLDDAATAAQVRPLLPGGPAVTLVTSRRRLSGLTLEGCYQMHLEPLDLDAAVELLAVTLADERVADQAEDARALVGLCAGLPLAVRLVGARLAARPRRRITTMVRALTAEHDRLDGLAIDGELSVRGVLDLSYQSLPSAAALLYRRLGLHPGNEFGSAVATAALAGSIEGPLPDAADLLDELYDRNLLNDIGEDRYRFHDLVRLHAAAKADEEESAEDRAATLRRIAVHYLATATRAEELLDPQHRTMERSFGEDTPVVEPTVDGPEAALDWLERELDNLMAVIRLAPTVGLPEFSWQLADAMWPLFPRRKYYDQWRAAHAVGLSAARQLADQAAICRMLTSGGLGELGRNCPEQARLMFEQAAEIFIAEGDVLGHARTLNYRGLAYQRLGRLDEAAALFVQASLLLPACGDHRAGALARLNAAEVARAFGRLERAAADAEAAQATLSEANDSYNAARAMTLLGRVRLQQGQPAGAEEALSEALAVLRRINADYETARALEALGEVAEALGQPQLAADRYREALDRYAAATRPEPAAEMRARLRRLDGCPEEAQSGAEPSSDEPSSDEPSASAEPSAGHEASD
ncbi:tetratricopeptide repeat protein [Streptomyces noursei]|uniref:ATP-binding protein n=1 Tax=Streptomyces noursei TaxID=1971 RepID=UPI00331D2815